MCTRRRYYTDSIGRSRHSHHTRWNITLLTQSLDSICWRTTPTTIFRYSLLHSAVPWYHLWCGYKFVLTPSMTEKEQARKYENVHMTRCDGAKSTTKKKIMEKMPNQQQTSGNALTSIHFCIRCRHECEKNERNMNISFPTNENDVEQKIRRMWTLDIFVCIVIHSIIFN